MKRLIKKIIKTKKPQITDTFSSGPELATTTSTIITSAADSTATATSAATASIYTAGVTTTHDSNSLSPNLAINRVAPVAYAEENYNKSLSLSHHAMMGANLQPTESEQYPSTQDSRLGLFPNAQNIVITGGTFTHINPVALANTGEGQTKILMSRKPNCSTIFTGRKDILDRLGKIFVRDADSGLKSRRSCLLWGLGGIGKTQICLKFTEEMASSFSHVFWVDASSHESITLSLMGIFSMPAAQAPGMDGSVESVLQRISCIQEEWLIVFDNADNHPELVAKYIPPGDQGNILITSRNRSMRRLVSSENIIEIDTMEELDAITLLLRASCLDASLEHQQAAKDIVAELGGIPLAISQAGAYIEAGRCDIDKYLRQLSLHHQALMSDATFKGASNYDRSAYGTWDLSLMEIIKRASGESTTEIAQAAQAAIQILQICAFFHHSNISKDIFRSAAKKSRNHVANDEVEAVKLPLAITALDHMLLVLDDNGNWDEYIFGQGISVLLSFSLMKKGESSEILSVHPLVHSWSREQMSKDEQQRMYQTASMILSCAIPWRFKSQDYALRQLIFPHIKANEFYGSQMKLVKQYYDDKYTNFALVMQENRDWNTAEQLQFQVVDMRKKLLGEECLSTLTSMANLAIIYRKQGRWNESEQLSVTVMNATQKLFGADHIFTITSMENIAIALHKQGKFNQAEQLEIQVIDMCSTMLGANHPDTLTSMANLAITYRKQGEWNKAEELETQVMNMRKMLLGPEHPDTLTSMANLSITYYTQGRWDEAEQLCVHVIEISKRLHGAEHQSTLKYMTNLANTYCHQGRWAEAEQIMVQVVELNKVIDENHPDTLTIMGNLASIYSSQGRLDKAEQLEIQIMDKSKEFLGAENPLTLTSMANLASTYCSQGKLDMAEQLGIQVLDMRKKLFGPEHLSTLGSMGNLAVTYHNQERWNEAEHLGAQVLEKCKELFGAGHPDSLINMDNLAATYYSQRKWNEAEQLMIQVMNIRKKQLGTEHLLTLMSMENLASTYYCQAKWDEAEHLTVQIMEINKKLHGIEHSDTLTSMANLENIKQMRVKA